MAVGIAPNSNASPVSTRTTRSREPCVSRIRTAVQENDPHALEEAAHALKGSTSTLGARTMQELCAALEDRAGSGDLEGSSALADALDAAFERTRRELEGLRESPA